MFVSAIFILFKNILIKEYQINTQFGKPSYFDVYISSATTVDIRSEFKLLMVCCRYAIYTWIIRQPAV